MSLQLAEYIGVSGMEAANPNALLQACAAWLLFVGIASQSCDVSPVAVSFGKYREMYVLTRLLQIDLHQ